MADEFQNLNINIAGVEDTGPQIKLRDHNKKTYSFFKNKKGGDSTVAFQDFQNFKIGDTVMVTFKEVPYRDSVIRNVISIREATGEPQIEPPKASQGGGKQMSLGGQPGREYWEKREQKRQSSILMQVAFKSAVALEAARVRAGGEPNRDLMYETTLDFYDWLDSQIVEETKNQKSHEETSEDENLGF